MKIIVPSSPDEIISEGARQSHCVASYIEKIAQKKCLILFLRRCGDEATPFYTIEVRGKQVTQVRGRHNSEATPEVNAFVGRWTREVLQAA